MNNSKKLYHFAVDTFIDLLSQLRGRKINYKCSNTDFANWDFFAHQFQTVNIGEKYVRDFIEFGLNNWFKEGERNPKFDKCSFMNVFNKAAIKRWNKIHPSVRTKIVRKELKQSFDIKIKRNTSISKMVCEVRLSEEIAKKKFHNTKKGLIWCISNTTLFLHKSSLCATCIFKEECKEILKMNYPKTYKKRGYDDFR